MVTGSNSCSRSGTGLGIALAIDGMLRRIRDVGAEVFVRGKTYDQTIGEHSRSTDEKHWGELLVMAVDGFVREFGATTVASGGRQRSTGDADVVRRLGVPGRDQRQPSLDSWRRQDSSTAERDRPRIARGHRRRSDTRRLAPGNRDCGACRSIRRRWLRR